MKADIGKLYLKSVSVNNNCVEDLNTIVEEQEDENTATVTVKVQQNGGPSSSSSSSCCAQKGKGGCCGGGGGGDGDGDFDGDGDGWSDDEDVGFDSVDPSKLQKMHSMQALVDELKEWNSFMELFGVSCYYHSLWVLLQSDDGIKRENLQRHSKHIWKCIHLLFEQLTTLPAGIELGEFMLNMTVGRMSNKDLVVESRKDLHSLLDTAQFHESGLWTLVQYLTSQLKGISDRALHQKLWKFVVHVINAADLKSLVLPRSLSLSVSLCRRRGDGGAGGGFEPVLFASGGDGVGGYKAKWRLKQPHKTALGPSDRRSLEPLDGETVPRDALQLLLMEPVLSSSAAIVHKNESEWKPDSNIKK